MTGPYRERDVQTGLTGRRPGALLKDTGAKRSALSLPVCEDRNPRGIRAFGCGCRAVGEQHVK